MRHTSKKGIRKPTIYNIRVEGHLDPCWSEWLDGIVIIPLENEETLLSGLIVDQAALHGLLAKVRDLNLNLISIERQMEKD
jgi:hypothetical protein